jgi:two-component system sensor histidine kinase PilS (NtrC family)
MTSPKRPLLSLDMSVAETETAIASRNWKVVTSLNYYRLVLALGALAIGIAGWDIPPFATDSPRVFGIAAIAYAAVAITFAALMSRRSIPFSVPATVLPFADVSLLTLLIHASGGIESGLGILLVLAVSGAALTLGTKLTSFFAALATVAIGLQHHWAIIQGEPWQSEGYIQLGLFGLALFAASSLTQLLVKRLRETEALAQQRGIDLENLAQVNDLIIQRMQAGVLVCDAGSAIRQINKAARDYLGLPGNGPVTLSFSAVSPDLAIQLAEWRSNPVMRRRIIHSRSGYHLLPRFVPIGERRDDSGVLVFLDDTTVLKQQAQQLKMSALARLTASIAHEIRNPLGAIAHAGQLLGESATLNDGDRRILQIVHDQSRRMNTIIENVTQLGRRDRVNLQKLELKVWLDDFIRQFCEGGEHNRGLFDLTAVAPLSICADPDQMGQVVGNLCTNAVRHSPAYQGKPLIRIVTGLDQGRHPFLEVLDQGPGVPAENLDKIFEPFFTTTPRGTGLGLYIAKELCEGNGAALSYHPRSEGGAGFRITFMKAEECDQFGMGIQ